MQSHLSLKKFANAKFDVPMARHLWLKLGGKAKVFFSPQSFTELTDFLAENAKLNEPLEVYPTGLGSKLIIRDGGFDGVILSTKAMRAVENEVNAAGETQKIWAMCGVGCAKLARSAEQLGYDNLNFLVGIPGSVGGALAMNSGCHQQQTWEEVSSVEWLDESGEIQTLTPHDFEVAYRNVRAKNNHKGLFLRAAFNLRKIGSKPLDYYLDWRKTYQPINQPNCGSVFKNPKNSPHSAGALIEKAGLKGFQIGGAVVSELHANFILNQGNAKAQDVEDLIHHIINTVWNRFEIKLEPEVLIIGKP